MEGIGPASRTHSVICIITSAPETSARVVGVVRSAAYVEAARTAGAPGSDLMHEQAVRGLQVRNASCWMSALRFRSSAVVLSRACPLPSPSTASRAAFVFGSCANPRVEY